MGQPKAETHKEATIVRRPAYIQLPKDVGTDDEAINAAAGATAAQPIKQVSGIWSSKPADTQAAAQISVKQDQDKPTERQNLF